MSFDTYLDMGELGDQEVTVEYDYRPGWKGSWNEPPEYEEAEITSVKWFGLEIISRIPKETIKRFVEESFDDVTGDINQALEDAAEARYFERKVA